jgi:NAD(P)H-hydrate repair Nnr-like enzyme with NAD(P)H-hydrate dehydratase domain
LVPTNVLFFLVTLSLFFLAGAHDIISNGVYTETCDAAGSPRRCGGQGDLLSGTLATFLIWSLSQQKCPAPGPEVIAAWGACRLARGCAAQANAAIISCILRSGFFIPFHYTRFNILKNQR